MLVAPVLLLLVLPGLEAASILGFFPFPGSSHHNLFGPLMEALAARGHRVLYVTPIRWESNVSSLEQLMVHNYGPQVLGAMDFIRLGQMSIRHHSQTVYDGVFDLLSHVLEEEGIQRLIHSEQAFDAVILESYFFQEANSALVHKFGAVGIEFVPIPDAAWVGELSGQPFTPSFMADYKTFLSDRMGVLDKLYSMYATGAVLLTSYSNLPRHQVLMDRYYNYTGWKERPPLREMLSNRSLILVNKDPLLGYPFPTAPHVKEVAGISVRPVKPLPQRLQRFMDEAEKGVIYMSLGLNLKISNVLKETFKNFLKVFSQLEQRVLMKWEEDYEGTLPSNILVMKKFPQQDILAHRKCVLFITHGGYMSLAETVYHAVPIVVISFYGDQPRNGIWAEGAGLGVRLDFRNLTESAIAWAVNEVLSNGRYRERTTQRSRMFKDRPLTPLEDAVYWIEHSIKYPYALTPASAYMSFLELHMLDIAIVIVAALAVAATIAIFLFMIMVKLRRGIRKVKKQ